MYSEKERDSIFNYLIECLKLRAEVLGVIQVGSGSVGYKDKYSDIDLAVVIEDTNINHIFKTTYNDINKKYNIFFNDNMEERKLQLFLLDNYLEIDIGYYTLETLYAKRENYKVIFDKTNKIENIMKTTWNEYKEKNRGTTEEIHMENIISFIDGELWYNSLHAIIAFKRNNIYRCYYELDQIKSYVIDLVAKRNNKESKRYRNIIELEADELEKINFLFIYPKNYKELSIYLKNALTIIFDEFNYWKERDNITFIGNLKYYVDFINSNND